MRVNAVFITINTTEHARLVEWWSKALGRQFDRIPVSNCREWDLTTSVIFQVIEVAEPDGEIDVSVHVDDVEEERRRMAAAGIELSEPELVPGFDELKWSKVLDPDGNRLNVLSGG